MKKQISIGAILFSLIFIFGNVSLFAEDKPAPPDIAANLTAKLLRMENKTNAAGSIVIFVIDAPEVAAELEKSVGMSIGKSKIEQIVESDDLPKKKPTVIFVGSESKVEDVIEYTRKKNILSITGDPALVAKGVASGIAIDESLNFKIFINSTASDEEQLDWHPAFLKIATIIE